MLDAIRTCLAELVALPSVSSTDPALDMGNQAVVECLANWLEPLGFHTVLQPIVPEKGKFNLIARFNPHGLDPASALILAGHTDTVPAEPAQWQGGPWRLADTPQGWRGLGVADMKGFPALVTALLRQWRADNRLAALPRPLTLVFTADEESTMLGGRALAALGEPLGAACIIGEPTGMQVVHAHKGMCTAQITVHGKAAHSSRPDLGLSAIEGMRLVLAALDALREELVAAHRHPAFALPHPTINPGAIHGGDAPNRVADICTLKLDVRLLPGMDPEAVQERLRLTVTQALDGTPYEDWSVTPLFDGVPFFETPPDAPFVRQVSQLTGKPPVTIDFATEGPFFNALGLQTLILGPGHVEQIHRPNEWVSPAELLQTAQILDTLAFSPPQK